MSFESVHYTFGDYLTAVIEAGFVLDAVREVSEHDDPRWSRVPEFLHLRARRA